MKEEIFMRIGQWMRKQRLLGFLLLGLLLFAIVFITTETANASAFKTNPQSLQLEAVHMINAHNGWAVEKDRTRVFHTTGFVVQ